MKSLKNYIAEAFKINRNTKLQKYNYFPETKEELENIIEHRMEVEGNKCNLNDIDTSKIKNMERLFYRSSFNGDISEWNVSNVEYMSHLFNGSFYFNGDISNWDVSNVKDMSGMFANSVFNGDISNWDVSNVKNMGEMFHTAEFNQDISNWNVSKVEDMHKMFIHSEFNQNISHWDVSNVKDKSFIFSNCPIEEKYKPKFR